MVKAISVARLVQAATTRHSTLYVWMMENHDTFMDVVKKSVRPNWTELAKAFAEAGLKDADGKPPSHEATRQTWWKVRNTIKARRTKRPVQPVTKKQPEPVATPPEASAEGEDDRPSEPSSRFSLRPATSRFKPKKEI